MRFRRSIIGALSAVAIAATVVGAAAAATTHDDAGATAAINDAQGHLASASAALESAKAMISAPVPTVTVTATVTATATPSPAAVVAGCQPAFAGDPCGKIYYGASSDVDTLAQQVGGMPTVHRTYQSASSTVANFVDQANEDLTAGRLPLESTKVPNGDWAGVAAGTYDTWLHARIDALANVNGPVWLAFHHEPNGDGAPADWIAMQKHVRAVIDATPGADNVVLVGILNGWLFTSNHDPSVWNCQPVGQCPQIMGFDVYNPWTPTCGCAWKSAADALTAADVIRSWGYKNTLVAEFGTHEDPANPGRAAAWMQDFYNLGLQKGLLAESYFNSSSGGGYGPLDGERLDAFKQLLAESTTAHP